MIEITPRITLHEDEIVVRNVRGSGPGGQHVNTTNSAIELRFEARNSPSLDEGKKARLERLAGSRMNQEGVIVLFAQNHRTSALNRADAVERLVDLIRTAAHVPKKRRPTKPTKASQVRRVDAKARRGAIKAGRGRPSTD
ncbi:MAG: aminoacyl-tRNA hydrolase [Pseudomonadota bacterium]|nr:aminoacyl-tRNA hydrolase [Pseudomonadota bacterium]